MGNWDRIYDEIIFNSRKSRVWFNSDFSTRVMQLPDGDREVKNPRLATFQLILNLLAQSLPPRLIVETGCQRMKNDLGAGMSTTVFGKFCSDYGGRLISVDNNPNHLKIAMEQTSEYRHCISYELSDSVEWLRTTCERSASLVYLDSLDYPLERDLVQARQSQEHCLLELEAAFLSGLISNKTVIAMDDTDLWDGGKPTLAKEKLIKMGWICLFDDVQTIWIKRW